MFEAITIIAIIAVIIIYLLFRIKRIKRGFEDKEEYLKKQVLKSVQEKERIEKESGYRMTRYTELQNQYKEMKEKEVLLEYAIECNNQAIRNEGNGNIKASMKKFVDKLREVFESEYCAIGIVSNGIAEDCIVSLERARNKKPSHQHYEDVQNVKKARDKKSTISQKELVQMLRKEKEIDRQIVLRHKKCVQKVKRVSVNNLQYNVSQALAKPGRRTYFDTETIVNNDHRKMYEMYILNSHRIDNTTIICIRDDNSINHGYIQFINSNKTIKYEDIRPYNDILLSLIDTIISSQRNQKEIRQKSNILKDFKFFVNLQNKTDNVDGLFEEIMEYLSREFHAGIISFRTPLLIGVEKRPVFILRSCYISNEIKKSEELRKHYFENRYIREKEQMGGFDMFRCQNQKAVFRDEARDYDYYDMIRGENLCEESFIIPILRDVEEKEKCIITGEKISECDYRKAKDCTERFEDYYGVFKLRLFEDDEVDIFSRKEGIDDDSSDEIVKRLTYLSKHISILLNYFISKTENASLQAFQEQLKNSSFTKIREFDKQCVSMVKGIVESKLCAIYRFDAKKVDLTLSATSAKKIQIGNSLVSLGGNIDMIMNECGIPVSKKDLNFMFISGHPLFYFYHDENNIKDIAHNESIMFIPMIKKDNTRMGLILLIGKCNCNDVSSVFWEHDKKTISFIVNVLTRIEESDSERLNFLSQLSHELLRPVTENVYGNDYIIDTARRNFDKFTKEALFQEIKKNIDRNMLFKYIIEDVEYVYSQTKEETQYYFEACPNDEVKELIVDTIRLFEKEASFSKSLSFETRITRAPILYIDKNKMMQVFINLIKNAIRYADNNSKIEVRYDYNENESVHEITFSNYGIGVDESEKDKIFELFFRGENAKEKDVRGTGMGLFLVAEIMKAHHGRCIVKRLKNPTEFTLQLPLINKNG